MTGNSLLVVLCVLALNQGVLGCGNYNPRKKEDFIPSYEAWQKINWVTAINRYRTNRKAANMNRVEWDEGLADKAQIWAEQCIKDHEPAADRVLNGDSYSQAMYKNCQYMGIRRPSSVTGRIYWQNSYYNYDTNTCKYSSKKRSCDSYAAMINAAATKFGCGHAFCKKKNYYWHSYVCNFSPGIVAGQKLYEEGTACSKCNGRSCLDGLCAGCAKVICQNCGKKNGCKCDCKPGYAGASCEKKCKDTSRRCKYPRRNQDYYCRMNNVKKHSKYYRYYRKKCLYSCSTECKEKFRKKAKC